MNRTHGYYGTRVYRIWQGVKNRATNKSDKDAYRYVNRGIDIDPRWMAFENFLSDLGEPPSDKHSIDRIDNARGYWPGNCRWVTAKQQSRNRRSNKKITFNGETLCLQEWADRIGISGVALRERIKRWPLELALTAPLTPISERRRIAYANR